MLNITLSDFIDPRGRADRRGFAILTAAFLVAQLAFGMMTVAANGLPNPLVSGFIHSLSVWVAITGTAKRLHDTGRSLWWFGGFMVVWMLWTFVLAFGSVFYLGPDAVADPGAGAILVVAVASMLPALAALLWLHFAPGEAGTNRYGPAPNASGFARVGAFGALPALR